MVDAESLGHGFSPDYGKGWSRRRIRLTATPGVVFAELEDHAHAMRCRLRHADGVITAIEPEFHRIPMNICPGAAIPLQELVGEPIGLSAKAFFANGRARRNCTHMFDLAWLASRQAVRGEGSRTYALDMRDSVDDNAEIAVRHDDQLLFVMRLENDVVIDPAPFAGRHLFKGFLSWLADATDIPETWVDAAMMVQKLRMIAGARRFILPPGSLSAHERQYVVGACHSYAADTIDSVVRSGGTTRDFSDHPERLLRFL